MDMYFFKAGKREDPMKGKLDGDMDAYWAAKDSKKKEEEEEAKVSNEALTEPTEPAE